MNLTWLETKVQAILAILQGEGGATINVDTLNADMEAITGGEAGDPGEGGKTLKDLDSQAAAILGALQGTGASLSRSFADPAGDGYTAAQAGPARACGRYRIWAGTSGLIVSFDNGVTENVRIPANQYVSEAQSIPVSAAIKVKRLTPGTAFDVAIVEVL